MKMLLLAILAAVLLAGCSSTPTGPVTPPKEGDKYVIHLLSTAFSPGNAQVPRNATVLWTDDTGTHDVTADDNSWGSARDGGANLTPGDTYEHRFTAAGVYHYKCTIHASTGMVGTITVA